MNRLYKFNWSNNEKRKTLKGRICEILTRGKKNSILVQFTDNGQKEIISLNAIRLIKRNEVIQTSLF